MLTLLSMQYAPVLFSQAGLPATTASFVASGVSGIIMFVCTFVVQFFADKCAHLHSAVIDASQSDLQGDVEPQ